MDVDEDEDDDDDGWMDGDHHDPVNNKRAASKKKAKKNAAKKLIVDSGSDYSDNEDAYAEESDEEEEDDEDEGDDDEDDDDDEIIETPVSKKRKVEEPPSVQSKASAASTVELLNSDEGDSDSSEAMIRKVKANSRLRSQPYTFSAETLGSDAKEGDGSNSQEKKKGGLLRKKNKNVTGSSSSSRLNTVDIDGNRDPLSSVKKARKKKSNDYRAARINRREGQSSPINLVDSDEEIVAGSAMTIIATIAGRTDMLSTARRNRLKCSQ